MIWPVLIPCPNDKYEFRTEELIFFKKRIRHVGSAHIDGAVVVKTCFSR